MPETPEICGARQGCPSLFLLLFSAFGHKSPSGPCKRMRMNRERRFLPPLEEIFLSPIVLIVFRKD